MQTYVERLRAITRKQRLILAATVAVGVLCFYALGIVTGFFGNRFFSAFWVLSNQSAYDVGYVILIVAAVGFVGALVYRFSRKLGLKLGVTLQGKKLTFVLVAAIYASLFYGFGIASGLFGDPVFSSFWIISQQTAYDLGYTIVAVSITLSMIMLVLFWIKDNKNAKSKNQNLLKNTDKL